MKCIGYELFHSHEEWPRDGRGKKNSLLVHRGYTLWISTERKIRPHRDGVEYKNPSLNKCPLFAREDLFSG